MDLSICIVSWNSREYLDACLSSIFKQSWRSAYEVLVCDNASSDGTADMVAGRYPQVCLQRNDRNVGFAAANNQLARQARGRYVLLLNPDTEVHPGALDRLAACFDAEPDVGVVGAHLLNTDGSLQYSCRSFPTLGTGLYRNTPLGRLFRRNRHVADYLLTAWDHSTERDVDWVSGACLAIRRDLLARIRFMDERYFMYCEDVDLCYQVHRAGFRVVYRPDALVTHHTGRSSDRRQAAALTQFHLSMAKFFWKNYRSRYSVFLAPYLLIGIAGRWLGAMLRLVCGRIRTGYLRKVAAMKKAEP